MKKKIQLLLNNQLLGNSVLMIIGFNGGNAINYLYHLIMARILGPAHYGELATLINVIGIVSMIPASLSLVIVKFVSSAKSADQISGLLNWFVKKTYIASGVVSLVFLILSPVLAKFLNIDNVSLLVILALTFLFILPALFYRSVLQGLLKFKEYVISVLSENTIKLVFGIGFVLAGFSVFGAMIGFVAATCLGFFLSRHFIRIHRSRDVQPPNLGSLFSYSLPVLIQSVAVTSLLSVDVILVKHFFDSYQTGIYAAFSSLGKIIFYGAGPISAVMFPLASAKAARGESSSRVFLYSVGATALLVFGVVLIYLFFPRLAINIPFGSSYLQYSQLLVYFGLFMGMFTIGYLFTNYFLSISKTKAIVLPVIAALVQVVGIFIFHKSLQSVILVSLFAGFLLLVSSVGYFLYLLQTDKKIG